MSLQIKVCLPNNEVVDGWTQHYDLPFNMVVVVTRYSPDLRTVCFSNNVQVQPHTNLLALKRCFKSGKLMQTHGVPSDDPCKTNSKGPALSTCKITMVCCWILFTLSNHYMHRLCMLQNLQFSYVHTSLLC
jgi:hypothetical protein